MWKVKLLISCFSALICVSGLTTRGSAQDTPSSMPAGSKTKKKAPPKSKKKTPAGAPLLESSNSNRSQHQFGVGLGLFNFFPPQPTIEGLWRYEKWTGVIEIGTFGIGVGEFGGEASYMGVGARYLLTDSFFVGGGFGKRHLVIVTDADLTVNSDVHTITWTRTTDQMVLTPKVGWESFSNRSFSFLFSAGLLMPSGTKFKVTRSMETVPGLPQEDLLAEQKKKGDDVRKLTTATMPYFESKVAWYF